MNITELSTVVASKALGPISTNRSFQTTILNFILLLVRLGLTSVNTMGNTEDRSQFKVYADERTLVYSAPSSTHTSITEVKVP